MDAAARAAASTLASAATPDANGEKLRRRLCQELDSMEREQPLRGTPHYRGHIGGRLAGHIGCNKFVAGVATDGRAKCADAGCGGAARDSSTRTLRSRGRRGRAGGDAGPRHFRRPALLTLSEKSFGERNFKRKPQAAGSSCRAPVDSARCRPRCGTATTSRRSGTTSTASSRISRERAASPRRSRRCVVAASRAS